MNNSTEKFTISAFDYDTSTDTILIKAYQSHSFVNDAFYSEDETSVKVTIEFSSECQKADLLLFHDVTCEYIYPSQLLTACIKQYLECYHSNDKFYTPLDAFETFKTFSVDF